MWKESFDKTGPTGDGEEKKKKQWSK